MDIKKFRAAVASGRATLKKLREKKLDSVPAEFKLLTEDGEISKLKIEVTPKRFSCKEYTEFNGILYPDGQDDPVCTEFTAAVIIGAHDEQGKRIFSEEDIDFLEDPLNAVATMQLANIIFDVSELSGGARAEKKPES